MVWRLSANGRQRKESGRASSYGASRCCDSLYTSLLLFFVCYLIGVGLVWGSAQAAKPNQRFEYSLPMQLRSEGRYEEAILLYANFAERTSGSPAAQEFDSLIDESLQELSNVEGAPQRLNELALRHPNRRFAAKALLILATKYHLSARGCDEALPIYERILRNYPDTPEAFRATINRAVFCLVARGQDNLALAELTSVAERAGTSSIRAYALYQLGVLYQWREDRDQARAAFEMLKQDYPINFEYLGPGGLRLVQAAVVAEQELNRYRLSPVLDKIMFHIRRRCGFDTTPAGPFNTRGGTIVQVVVVFLFRAVSLLVIVVLLGLVRTFGIAPGEAPITIFQRPWSLIPSCAFLLGVWFIQPLGYILGSLIEHQGLVRWSDDDFFVSVAHLSTFGMVGVMLAGSLWGESLARVFGIRQGLVLRVIFAITGVCVAYLVLSRAAVLLLSGSSGFPIVIRDRTMGFGGGAGAAVVFLMNIMAKATAEECVYRGVVFESFRRQSGSVSGAVLSSILFALSHAAPIGTMTGFFMFGLVALYLRERFHSLLPSVILHVVVNCVASVR
jgi:membrane protease YdiL (CAAX protease family)/tetratricopeptide (TPR) repeat protein